MAEPSLTPLRQWICDTCGTLIREPKHGWVEWHHDGNFRYSAFRICHHAMASPLGGQEGCYKYGSHPNAQDAHLHHLSEDHAIHLMSYLDVGPIHDPGGPQTVNVDIRSWSELYRRLYLPYYEEARLYFEEARSAGFYEGHNELLPYIEDTLIRVIREFKQ